MSYHFDLNTFIIIVFNCAVYAVMWYRGTQKDAVREYQHGKMWRQYEKDHKINGGYDNG